MKKIAHRGNYCGRIKEKENHPSYIAEAISLGYDVEIDVWLVDGEYFFGHDAPEIKVDLYKNILPIKSNAWFHAKNHAALAALIQLGLHVFFHDSDEYTITSKGIIWAFTGKPVNELGVAVMPEYTPGFKVPNNCYGVCTDDFSKIL